MRIKKLWSFIKKLYRRFRRQIPAPITQVLTAEGVYTTPDNKSGK